jgi:hypothetical protein
MTNELSTNQKLLAATAVVNVLTEQLKKRADVGTELVKAQEDRRVLLSGYKKLLAGLTDILSDNCWMDDGRGYPHHVVYAQDVTAAIEAASQGLYEQFNFDAEGSEITG